MQDADAMGQIWNVVVKSHTDIFFALLRSALWGTDMDNQPHLAADEWRCLYDESRKHAVQGIMFDAVRRLPDGVGMPAVLAAEWLVESGRVEKVYGKIVAAVATTEGWWKENGIDAIQLKGTTVAALYPNPSHRVMGDVDWWFSEDNGWERAVNMLHGRGIALETDSDGDCHFVWDGVVVELHRKGMKIDGNEGMLLMLNEHILHHLMVSGMGMRHLCDMTMAYHACHGQMDTDKYRAILRKSGLIGWTALLESVLVDILGLPKECTCVLDSCRNVSRSDEERLVSMVLADGNFGFGRDRRFRGSVKRFFLFVRYVPCRFAMRWIGLAAGRLGKLKIS